MSQRNADVEGLVGSHAAVSRWSWGSDLRATILITARVLIKELTSVGCLPVCCKNVTHIKYDLTIIP